MDKDKSKVTEKDKSKGVFRLKKGGREMATQLQPTPILHGKDAENVIEQVKKKPTEEQRKKAEERKAYFEKIDKKGLR